MDKVKRSNIFKSLFISLAYVGLGTISVLSVYPSSPLSGDWVVLAMLITLPVNFISAAIVYASSSATELVLVVQFFYFLICWLIVYFILNRITNKRRIAN